MSFCTNEARQFLLAKKHNDVKGSYVTTGLVGNIVDAVTHVFLIGGFGFHLHSINSYSKDYPQGPNIIFPFFNDEHLISYCPFNLPTTLIYAQASYRFQIFISKYANEITKIYQNLGSWPSASSYKNFIF